MTFDQQLHLALSLLSAHKGQLDKQDKPFVLHILRVALAGESEDEIIVGLLHDLLEDTPVCLEDLIAAGFPLRILEAVAQLTRLPEESYWEYIEGVITNPLAARVKIHDLNDNTLPWRQTFPGAQTLVERHYKARDIVSAAVRGQLVSEFEALR